jgi:hypothetical protein
MSLDRIIADSDGGLLDLYDANAAAVGTTIAIIGVAVFCVRMSWRKDPTPPTDDLGRR